jgi:hypothetical protein
MSGGNEFTEAALWRRWRDGADAAGEPVAEPDALALAAYADRRLGRPGADPETDPAIAAVEAWLARHPDHADDIIAARNLADPSADAVLVARAQALLGRPEGTVVALPRPRHNWRDAVAWSSIAASLIAAVLIGFSLGDDGVVELSGFGTTQAQEQPLIGAPSAFLATDDEESGI